MTVFLVSWNTNNYLVEESKRLYEDTGTFDCSEKEDLAEIKLHVKELGNAYYVQPFLCP
ncbi:TPA: hypothetical protein HA273_03795 [Candidatus Bathyarchaeota archaeon]|nr:hypothetical protein [Candidatus Bathyarchaeota archaeon]HIJ08926.1 hypothetical protein [Candidatus Bathyarchaeota archaeon]